MVASVVSSSPSSASPMISSAERAELFERRRGLFGEVEAMDAPVVRVGTPLDETGGVELVDEARDGDGGEIEDARELALACALAALQAAQHRPLGAGRRQLARALVGQGAQQPRNIMQGESEFAGRG